MDTIKTYLDNVFAAFPQTERVLALKRDMLAGMEEKYLHLRQHGHSEYEAIGTVIANFGSIDEIAAELGIASEPVILEAPETSNPNVLSLSHKETLIYLADIQHYGSWLGAALAMIFFGAAFFSLFDGDVQFITITTFFSIAIAFGLILGKTANFYSAHKKHFKSHSEGVNICAQTRLVVEEDYSNYMKRYRRRLKICVALACLVAYAWIMSTTTGNSSLANPVILIGVGIAVYLFVAGGVGKLNYDYILGKWSGAF